jgi:hypothetical protein
VFALSMAPFDRGWYTEVKATSTPIWWQKSLNIWQLNYLVLSTVIFHSTPKRHIMFCQKNLLSPTTAMLTRDFASIHFVKYSTATTAYL